MLDFPTQLRSAMQTAGLSRAQTASVLDVHPSSIEKWLNNRNLPHHLAQEGALYRLAFYTAAEALTQAHQQLGAALASLAAVAAATTADRSSSPDALSPPSGDPRSP